VRADRSFHLGTIENAVKRPVVEIVVEQGNPSVSMEIKVERRSLIVDTGSSISIRLPDVLRSEMTTTSVKPYGVTGKAFDVKGRQSLSFILGGQVFHHSFFDFSLPT